MTATTHALIGTIIAAKIGNPALAIPIAIASHIAADAIPHWDTATNRKKKTFKKENVFLPGRKPKEVTDSWQRRRKQRRSEKLRRKGRDKFSFFFYFSQ